MKNLYQCLITVALVVVFCSCATRKKVVTTASIQKKYAGILGVSEKSIDNARLYSFIEAWYGVPYQYAGKSKKGVDCSGFTSILYKEAFGKSVNGQSYSLFDQCEKIQKENLREGDLVFFKISPRADSTTRISHVGVYLQNNKFVHASSYSGVKIDDLNNAYYLKYFEEGGRIR